MNKNKNKLLFLAILFFFLIPILTLAAGSFEYVPMESIPIFGKSSDFCTYLNLIYKFGIATVSICAMFMLIIGGFMYATSAGNNASMGKAKEVVTDALIGLILAMTGWLILNIIDPYLTKCLMPKIGLTAPSGTIPGGTAPIGTGGECDDSGIRQDLTSSGGISFNKTNCPTVNDTNCTSVCNLPGNAISGLKKIQSQCGSIIVTGGTEAGHGGKAYGQPPHAPGYPTVDIRNTGDALGDCLKKGATDGSLGIKCLASSNPARFNYGCTFADGSDHYHIVFN